MHKASSSFFQKRILTSFLFFLLLVTFGCHSMEGVSTTLMPEGKIALKRLVIIPFEDNIPEDEMGRMMSCPLCGAIFQTEKYTRADGAKVEDLFAEGLRESQRFTIVNSDNVAEVYRRVGATFKGPLIEKLKIVGSELGADGVLFGYIYRYRERKGYYYSVEKPASVAFDVHLIRASDGLIVWRGAFDKTQMSLMENLFQLSSFFRWGLKWITARELAEEGVTEILQTFPGIK